MESGRLIGLTCDQQHLVIICFLVIKAVCWKWALKHKRLVTTLKRNLPSLYARFGMSGPKCADFYTAVDFFFFLLQSVHHLVKMCFHDNQLFGFWQCASFSASLTLKLVGCPLLLNEKETRSSFSFRSLDGEEKTFS